jgi:RNA polymerase sigma factor (sigma-70 family)
MILQKLDSISTAAVQEKGIESVVEWFDRHKDYFYTIGWCYLRSQQQMEELFYRSILKVHKELPRYKGKPSFQMWVTNLFIQNCRELSRDNSLRDTEKVEPRQDIFEALDQLEGDEKEALILTYVIGFSKEEAANIIGVTKDKIKDILYSGTQSVRNQLYGSSYHGCKEYHEHYIDYLEKSMERSEKIEFEVHIYNCQRCQNDLASFQEVSATRLNDGEGVSIPPYFMENVKKRLTEKKEIRQQQNKKRKKMALVSAGVFAFIMAIGFFTGAFPKLYYAMTEEDEQLRAFLQEGLGERLSLEAESGGVKVKITGVVADDVQTLVFYEIHDTKEDSQYIMNYEDGLLVENEREMMKFETFPRYSLPDLEVEMNNKEKNVFYGKVGLRPLKEEESVIKLQITQLRKVVHDPSTSFNFSADEYKKGAWSFEFPVTKQSSTEYALKGLTEIEGIPIRFDKITIAPTATILQYGIHTEQSEKRIDLVNFDELVVNDKKAKADRFGSLYMENQQDNKWIGFQSYFEPLYGEKPKEISARLAAAFLSVEDKKSINLDETLPYPLSVDYAGSTLSIDQIQDGSSTNIVISNHELNNRKYESLHINMVDENENELILMHMDVKGVLVDKNGVEYDMFVDPSEYEKIEQPRYLITEQSMKLEGNNETPKRLLISGYNTTLYLDEVVGLRVE